MTVLRQASRSALRGAVFSPLLALAAGTSGPTLPQSGSIAARWMADSITPQTDNTAIGTWTDVINGYALTQGTGANQPKYRASQMGGKPCVQFAGSQWLAGLFPGLKTIIDAKNYSVLIVFSNTVAAGNGTLFGNGAGGNSFAYQSTGSTTGRFDASNTGLSVPTAGTAFMTLGHSSRTTAQYPLQSGTALERIFVNGGCVTSSTLAGPATSSASGAFAMGATNDLGQLSGKFMIYEVIVWNTTLQQTDFLQAESYLRAKYSQTLPWAGLGSVDVYLGDSLTVGVNATPVDVSHAYPYLSATGRGRTYGQYINMSVGGCNWVSIQQQLTEIQDVGAYMGVPMNISAWEWRNEFVQSHSPTTIYNNAVTFCTAARAISGVKLMLMSSTGYSGDATDPYATVRGAYNDLLDANFASMCDQYGPIHSDATAGPAIGNATAYTNNSATYWSGDGVHLKTAGYGVLATFGQAQMTAMRA